MKTEWKQARVGDILKIRNGYAVKSSDYSQEGIPLIRQSDINGDTIDISTAKRVPTRVMEECGQYLVRKGDLLIGMSGSLGKIGRYVDEEVAIQNQRTGLLQVKSGFTAGFAKLVLKLVEQQIIAEGKGVAVQNVSAKEIEDCTFPLPPEGERERIVAEIEKQVTRLEAGVASLKRVQIALKRYRASVLKAACKGQFRHEPISAAIESLDQGWSPKCERGPSPSDDVWAVIKTSAIQHGRFVECENKRLPAALRPRPHLELQPGDLLITRAGPRARAGVACLIKSTRPRLMLCDKAYRIRAKHDIADPAFLEIVLNAPHVVDEIDELKTGISDSGVNLTQKRFGELVIPLPSIAEQQRIVAEMEWRLSVIEELEAVTAANLQRAIRLRRSVLHRAFSGRLTCARDGA